METTTPQQVYTIMMATNNDGHEPHQ